MSPHPDLEDEHHRLSPLAVAVELVLIVLLATALALVEIGYLTVHVGAVPVPATVLLAALGTPVLARWAYSLRGSLPHAWMPAVVWLLISLLASFPGPGGDVLLPGDWRSVLYLLAGLIAGAGGTAWAIRPAGPRRGDAGSPSVTDPGVTDPGVTGRNRPSQGSRRQISDHGG